MLRSRRKHHFVEGCLRPGELLTVRGVMRKAGIGREKLAELRRAKKLKSYIFGGTGYYKSDDIIALILSGDERQASRIG